MINERFVLSDLELMFFNALQELVNKLRAHAFETRDQLPRTCVLTEQIPVGPSGTKGMKERGLSTSLT